MQNARAVSSSWRSAYCTPAAVFMTTKKSANRRTTETRYWNSVPNRMISSGSSASLGELKSDMTHGLRRSSAILEAPIKTPSGMPIASVSRKPRNIVSRLSRMVV